MLNQIKKVKDKVEYLLANYPVFRDDDQKLIAKIWYSESSETILRDFLINFGNGKYTSPEAIRRARQKLQEENPNLRGNLYSKRHKNAKKVKHNINSI